jgi:hypothetical protein
VAASLLGLRISPLLLNQPPAGQTTEPANAADERWFDVDEETGQRLPYAWIVTYPATEQGRQGRQGEQQQQRRPPEIGLRSLHASQRMMEHEIACLLGYWHRDYHRLTDPDSPSGSILIPHDPSIETLLHQYAIGLLCLPRDCPTSWHCHCNGIRKRFNAPPPGHEQPTGTLTLAELEHENERQRTNTEPRFPYPDINAWTDEE